MDKKSAPPAFNANRQSDAIGTIVFLVIAAIYLALFYTCNSAHYASLSWIIIPDDLVMQWMGMDVGRFALFDRWPIVVTVAGIGLVSFAAGRWLLTALRIDRVLSRIEVIVLSIAAGLQMWSLWTLAVGLVGGLHQRAWFLVPAVIVVGVAAVQAWRKRSDGRHDKPRKQKDAGDATLSRRWLWAVAPFVMIFVMGGMLPPWEFDVREYHLQVPKEWYRQGRIDFTPHNVYGNMPLGAEMHALLAMTVTPKSPHWWWGALAGKTIIACFAPLTALALYAAGKRFFSQSAAIAAALLYVSWPWVTHVSNAGLIDCVLACYFFLAVYVLFLWWNVRESGRDQDARRLPGLIILAGWLAGAAVSCKYPAVLFVAIPLTIGVFFAGVSLRKLSSIQWRAAVLFVLAGTISCGLWFGKNWVLTGNPTYPLLYDLFGGKSRTDALNERWEKAHRPPPGGYTPGQLWSSIKQVAWGNPTANDWQSPLIVPLLAAAVIWSRRQMRIQLALWSLAAFVFLAWWLFTHRIDRFWLPAAPILALLAAAGASSIPGRTGKIAVTLFFALGLTANLLTDASRGQLPKYIGDNRFLVSLDQLRADRPHEKDFSFHHFHPAHDQLNQIVPEGAVVLLVGDALPFDLDPPVIYSTCFDPCPFEQIMKGRTREERLHELKKRNITHLFIFWQEIRRYRSTYGFSDYVTPQLVHAELLEKQGVLRKIPQKDDPQSSELFEVVY